MSRLVGYRYEGLSPGTHLGLPGAYLTLVLSFRAPTRVAGIASPDDPPAAFEALLGGLYTRPVVILYDTELHGIQLDLTPRGARALLGFPSGELAGAVVDLQALLGPWARELTERLAQSSDWGERFELLERMLWRRIADQPPPSSALELAWRSILTSGGGVRIGDLATEVGYSRRQLDVRFAGEYGLTPKQLARVVRFERSHRLLRTAPRGSLAVVAAACGYYDQSHMVREWRSLAGCAPSRWLDGEELPFIQDERGSALPI
jgi:AraC-like DNA-binding protein